MKFVKNICPPQVSSILILVSVTLLIWYLQETLNYWKRRGVPYSSLLKCASQTFALTFKQKAFFQAFYEQFHELEGYKYGGTFQLFRPSMILRDPAMIVELFVKEFSSFCNRAFPGVTDENLDKLSGNLLQLTDDRWRTVRHTLSPAFSSAKLRIMFETLRGCAQELNAYMQTSCLAEGEAEIEIKELVSNYTMDVIGACAMGIKCNAIQDPSNCDLKRAAQGLFRLSFRRLLFVVEEVAVQEKKDEVKETLRKYPTASVLGRTCTESFKIPGSSVVVEKGVKVFVSTYGLHHDPKYFPEPEKFDPNRFSEANLDKIVPGSYLSFGKGPRSCIAIRLALMDVTMMVITMISSYTLHPCAKTPGKIRMGRNSFPLSPEGDMWLRLKKMD